MQLRKMIFTLVIAISLIIPNLYHAHAEDIVNNKYELLTKLAIMDVQFESQREINRAEAVTIVLRLMGWDNSSDVKDYSFKDLDPSHWAYQYISSAINMGIVNGYTDGSFKPDATVTLAEFSKMIICAIHYEYLAEANGGYPTGYVKQAMPYISGLSLGQNDNLNRQHAAHIIYNLLVSKIAFVEGLKQDQGESLVTFGEKEYSILNKIHNTYKATGQIEGNEYFNITNGKIANQGNIIIDNKEFVNDFDRSDDLIGFNVEYYYKLDEEADEQTLIFAVEKGNNKSYYIPYDLIAPETTMKEFVYYKNDIKGDTLKVQLDPFISVIYNNGFLSSGVSDNTFKPKYGFVKLILTDKLDVAFIEDYQYYMAKSVNTEDEMIYLKELNAYNEKFNGMAYIDYGQFENYKILKDGKKIEPSEIAENNVLAVTVDISNKNLVIEVMDHKIEGTLDEISDGHYVIDGIQYPYIKSENGINPYSVKLSDYGTFYLGYNNVKEGNLTLGYISQIYKQKSLDSGYSVRIFNLAGEFETYYTASKIKIDDNGNISGGDLGNYITQRQLVKYSLDNEGKLKVIKTAVNATDKGFNRDEFSLDFKNEYSLYCGGGRIAWNYLMGENPLILFIPNLDLTIGESYADIEYRYRIANTSFFVDDNYYDVEIYDSSEVGRTNLIVVYEGDLKLGYKHVVVSQNSPAMLIDKVTTGIDEKTGEIVTKFYGYVNGEYISKNLASEAYIDTGSRPVLPAELNVPLQTLKQGDYVQYVENSSIKFYRPLFIKGVTDKKNDLIYNTPYASASKIHLSSLRVYYGEVYKVMGNDMAMTLDNGITKTPYLIDKAVVYKFKNGKIVLSSKEELNDAEDNRSKIMMHITSGVVKTIFICE